MADSIQIYEFDNNPVVFQHGPKGMINATQMVQVFGKRIDNFMRLKQTKQFIKVLADKYGSQDLVLTTVKGGRQDQQGTYVCRLLGLKLAAWLSPEFEVWVFERICELLDGKPQLPHSTQNTLQAIVDGHVHHEQMLAVVSSLQHETNTKLDELIAKTSTVNQDYYAIAGYCSLHNIACPLHLAQAWGKQCVTLSNTKNLPMGETHDPRFGRVRTYHSSVLQEIIK